MPETWFFRDNKSEENGTSASTFSTSTPIQTRRKGSRSRAISWANQKYNLCLSDQDSESSDPDESYGHEPLLPLKKRRVTDSGCQSADLTFVDDDKDKDYVPSDRGSSDSNLDENDKEDEEEHEGEGNEDEEEEDNSDEEKELDEKKKKTITSPNDVPKIKNSQIFLDDEILKALEENDSETKTSSHVKTSNQEDERLQELQKSQEKKKKVRWLPDEEKTLIHILKVSRVNQLIDETGLAKKNVFRKVTRVMNIYLQKNARPFKTEK